VLQDLDLDIAQGERVAVLGLNGAGKTTLMKCVLGLTAFDGDLTVAGGEVRAAPRSIRARIGYVPQRAPHFEGTLAEVVAFFAELRGVSSERVRAQLAALELPLAAHGAKPVRTLSGGMLQKVLLALALASEVHLLLLDEPTANLDPRARREFLRALRATPPDTTIVMASHRLTDVEAVADRLIVLHGGGLVFNGSTAELWRRGGAASTLWIKVPAATRDGVRDRLRAAYGDATLVANGAAVGVQVDHGTRTALLAELQQSGILIEDFWTEPPSLHDVLDRMLSA
jgi:ABC-type multidrug transport system ATPase subunit